MKKIFAILAMAISASAFAGDSVTIENQHVNNAGAASQQIYGLGVKHEFTSNFAGDVNFTNAQTDGTNALSTRLEAGITASTQLYGPVTGYVRTALGEKYSNTASFAFYSIEPGVTAPVGPFTAKVGVRYRSAVDADKNNDQTHTVRTTLSYPLTKVDTVSVRYDRVRGDNNQKIWIAGYTHSF